MSFQDITYELCIGIAAHFWERCLLRFGKELFKLPSIILAKVVYALIHEGGDDNDLVVYSDFYFHEVLSVTVHQMGVIPFHHSLLSLMLVDWNWTLNPISYSLVLGVGGWVKNIMVMILVGQLQEVKWSFLGALLLNSGGHWGGWFGHSGWCHQCVIVVLWGCLVPARELHVLRITRPMQFTTSLS